MKKKRFLLWIMAVVIFLSVFAVPQSAQTVKAMTVLEADVTEASEDCTFLGVYGSYYSQAQDALDRINEIRREACEDGNVPDPRNSSRMLTAEDYVPIKWSSDLENIARIRAAEGGLAYSFLGSGHDRLNGKGTFSISSNGVSSFAEDLAYNWGTSMVSGINQWYAEKADWVNQAAGQVTGHYTSMINPSFTYVGLGDFYTKEATFPNTLAGEFTYTSQELDQTMQEASIEIMQKLEVKKSYIEQYILEGIITIDTDTETTLTPRVNLVNGSKHLKLWALESVTYTSSDTAVATVTDDGVVTGHRSGEAMITAEWNGSALASVAVTIECAHEKELLSSMPPTCIAEGSNIYHCEVCGKNIEEKIAKTAHDYIYSDTDSEGYRTGICSVCQDTIKMIPPTSYQLWWRNSTSDSSYYSSVFPDQNPVDSIVYCWIEDVNGDADYRDIVIESSDESVIAVQGEIRPNTSNNQLRVLAPGIAAITIYPKYNPDLKRTVTVRAGDAGSVDITGADAVLSQTSYTYTGRACMPNASVTYKDILLKNGIDYTIAYENNLEAGTATAVITGTGIFGGTIQKNFTITKTDVDEQETKALSQCEITVTPLSYVYDGTEKKPSVTVKDGSKFLVINTDYTVVYANNKNAGTAAVIVTGKGKYSGTVIKFFTIKSTSVSSSVSQSGTEQTSATYKVGSCQYKITAASTVSVTGIEDSKASKVKIPSTVKIGGKTFKVTAIENKAFRNKTKITSVEIGGNISKIGASAFEGCTKLTKVTIGKGVTEISKNAFKNCKKLRNITVKSSKLKKVGKNVLKGIKKSAKIKVPAKKLSAYQKLFKNKGQGKKVKISK